MKTKALYIVSAAPCLLLIAFYLLQLAVHIPNRFEPWVTFPFMICAVFTVLIPIILGILYLACDTKTNMPLVLCSAVVSGIIFWVLARVDPGHMLWRFLGV